MQCVHLVYNRCNIKNWWVQNYLLVCNICNNNFFVSNCDISSSNSLLLHAGFEVKSVNWIIFPKMKKDSCKDVCILVMQGFTICHFCQFFCFFYSKSSWSTMKHLNQLFSSLTTQPTCHFQVLQSVCISQGGSRFESLL